MFTLTVTTIQDIVKKIYLGKQEGQTLKTTSPVPFVRMKKLACERVIKNLPKLVLIVVETADYLVWHIQSSILTRPGCG